MQNKIIYSSLLLFISFFISSKSFSSYEPWSKVVSPTTKSFFNCSFVDSLYGWAAGDSGIIVHTSNGGTSYAVQTSPIDYYINDIFFVNRNIGWAVANQFLLEGTTILKTSNGGMNWAADNFFDSTKILRTVYFLNASTGFLGGFGGVIFKTTNAGINWFETQHDSSSVSSFPIAKFKFVDENLGFACGGYNDIAGIVWRTTNGGLIWKAESLASEPFFSIYIRNPLHILAVGGDYEYGAQLTRSSNSGESWSYQSLQIFGQAESIDFRTPREGWMALSYAAAWAVSQDSGKTWASLPVIDNLVIKSVAFSDSLHGWAFGNNGVILKYNPEPVGINFEQAFIPTEFSLEQNYPNPFNPNTNISYIIGKPGFVTIKVYDIKGNEIKTLINQYHYPGRYNIKFEVNGLSSGSYFYRMKVRSDRMETENFSETRRMVFLK